MPIQIPEPHREAFVTHYRDVFKHGMTRDQFEADLRRAADITECESTIWWQAVGSIIGMEVRDLFGYRDSDGPGQEG